MLPEIPWDDIRHASSRIGPNLLALRQEQERQPFGRHESYSLEHARRLEMFPPKRSYPRKSRSKHCSEVHPQVNGICPYGCKSCHFCRQRTIEPKTVCSRCEGINNFYGGKGRGYWCGSCLWARMGENAEEVMKRKDWICPACRDLCNCSGVNCMRIKRGWFPSGQLHSEAKSQGFRSVAHYLVLTHLSSKASAAPISENIREPANLYDPRKIERNLVQTLGGNEEREKEATLLRSGRTAKRGRQVETDMARHLLKSQNIGIYFS